MPRVDMPVRMIDGNEVLTVDNNIIPDGRVYLVPLKFYKLVLGSEFMNLNDEGITQLREGFISFVSRVYATGSMEYGQKFRPATAVTIGTTVPDNAEQNAFRVFNIV
jgi:hypothetical protein